MKNTIKILSALILMQVCGTNAFSQMKSFCIKGTVTYVDDMYNTLNGAVSVGDSINGTIIYDAGITDNNSMAEVGDYYNTVAPSGIYLNLNGLKFETDTTNINFLFETVNDYVGLDNIVVRSYNNTFTPTIPAFVSGNHISWQLDDTSETALTSTAIPAFIDVNNWQQVFGLTIEGGEFDTTLFIRAMVTSADTMCASLTSVEDLIAAEHHTIYPNPFSSLATIRFASTVKDAELTLCNLFGQKIKSIPHISGNSTTIYRENLQNGTYFSTLSEPGKAAVTTKLIIND
jgi:hypothetical protein